MLLNEFVYFNDQDSQNVEDGRYDPSNDTSVLSIKDTRKTRLTLKMINQLRVAGEAREKEAQEDLELIQHMYSQANNLTAAQAAASSP